MTRPRIVLPALPRAKRESIDAAGAGAIEFNGEDCIITNRQSVDR